MRSFCRHIIQYFGTYGLYLSYLSYLPYLTMSCLFTLQNSASAEKRQGVPTRYLTDEFLPQKYYKISIIMPL